MITPRFECSQTDNYVTIKIKVPYAKVSEMEYYVLENEFKFFVKPYFLRLTFKEKLNSEEGSDKSSYDIDKGEVTIEIAKSEPGKQFPDLNMLTSLLAKPNPSKQKISKPKIEVLSSQTFENENENNNENNNNQYQPSLSLSWQAGRKSSKSGTLPALHIKNNQVSWDGMPEQVITFSCALHKSKDDFSYDDKYITFILHQQETRDGNDSNVNGHEEEEGSQHGATPIGSTYTSLGDYVSDETDARMSLPASLPISTESGTVYLKLTISSSVKAKDHNTST
eukprot:gb/GECH01013628.1/.p1 GENE.gb/GECH01013628.1/~~gb/GECH01013628.1/.p1  ORF type:complete len:281 (+),score=79.10 gb/GECH01013628.1/:1-843(+)